LTVLAARQKLGSFAALPDFSMGWAASAGGDEALDEKLVQQYLTV
jgi:hypothetical protein